MTQTDWYKKFKALPKEKLAEVLSNIVHGIYYDAETDDYATTPVISTNEAVLLALAPIATPKAFTVSIIRKTRHLATVTGWDAASAQRAAASLPDAEVVAADLDRPADREIETIQEQDVKIQGYGLSHENIES
jgi:hypothetical protein